MRNPGDINSEKMTLLNQGKSRGHTPLMDCPIRIASSNAFGVEYGMRLSWVTGWGLPRHLLWLQNMETINAKYEARSQYSILPG